MRDSLVAALIACADQPSKPKARRFLAGLSADELQFIAEFLGSCILDSQEPRSLSRPALAERVARFQLVQSCRRPARSNDREHKMLVLLEYLRCGAARATG